MIITKVARIPLKVPMMLAQLADGSMYPCVAVTHVHVDGMSDDVVCVVESEITRTPTNFKYRYQPSQTVHGKEERLISCMVFNLVEQALSSFLHITVH